MNCGSNNLLQNLTSMVVKVRHDVRALGPNDPGGVA